MKKLTLVLTPEEIAATLSPLYEQYNRDSRAAYETRRDFPETLFNPEGTIDAQKCDTMKACVWAQISGVERLLREQCGVEFSHYDHFHPCHEYEKVGMSLPGGSYCVVFCTDK